MGRQIVLHHNVNGGHFINKRKKASTIMGFEQEFINFCLDGCVVPCGDIKRTLIHIHKGNLNGSNGLFQNVLEVFSI